MSAARALWVAAILVVIAGLLGGCARTSYPNQPLAAYQPAEGYRFDRLGTSPENELLIILAFSGGGMRASALSFGALEELERVRYSRDGTRRTLLDEVDIVSSVSGGSVPAAAYALERKEMLRTFPGDFLYQDILGQLELALLSPGTWVELASPDVSRIDVLAGLFDEKLFHGARYAELEERGTRPFLVLNAADMSTGAVFSFTQERFEALCSDLTPFPLSKAVAASAAFPVALTPVTLKNYSGEPCPAAIPTPRWIEQGLRDKDANFPRFKRTRLARAMRRLPGADRSPEYIHLLDGGLADNLGLRGPVLLMTSTDVQPSLMALMNMGQIKRIAVIVVNARSDPDRSIDHHGETPGIGEQLKSVTSVPIDTVIADSRDQLDAVFGEIERAKQTYRECRELLGSACTLRFPLAEVNTYLIEVDFDRLDDAKLRHRLKNIPTTWTLERKDVDTLRAVACRLLRGHPQYRRLLADVGAAPVSVCPPVQEAARGG